jgi:hypothetical protein
MNLRMLALCPALSFCLLLMTATVATVLDRRSGESFSHRCMRREFRIAQPDDYSHYRLDVTRNHGTDFTQFAELSLFERSGK